MFYRHFLRIGKVLPNNIGTQNMENRMNGLRERLHRWRLKETEKMRDMTPEQKASYIVSYYWLWILGIAAVLFLTVFILYRAFFSVKDYWFYGMYANTMENGGNGSSLWIDFVAYAGYDPSEKKIEMNSASWFDPTVQGGTNNSYYQAFVALSESGDLDVLVMGKDGLAGIGRSGRLLDLNDEKCAGIRSKYGERIVTCEPYDEEYSTEPVPVGIDVSDSLLVTKYHLYDGDCVLGINAYTERLESVEMFLEFIFDDTWG